MKDRKRDRAELSLQSWQSVRSVLPRQTFVLLAGVLGVVVQACTATDRWVRSYDDPAELAQAICDEVVHLETERPRAARLAPLLEDRRVLYAGEPDVDEAVRAVTVRDAAYSILDGAGLLPPDLGDRAVKLIAACQVDSETARIHIPILDDRDFAAARTCLVH